MNLLQMVADNDRLLLKRPELPTLAVLAPVFSSDRLSSDDGKVVMSIRTNHSDPAANALDSLR